LRTDGTPVLLQGQQYRGSVPNGPMATLAASGPCGPVMSTIGSFRPNRRRVADARPATWSSSVLRNSSPNAASWLPRPSRRG